MNLLILKVSKNPDEYEEAHDLEKIYAKIIKKN